MWVELWLVRGRVVEHIRPELSKPFDLLSILTERVNSSVQIIVRKRPRLWRVALVFLGTCYLYCATKGARFSRVALNLGRTSCKLLIDSI
jgi:hypothetical protein